MKGATVLMFVMMFLAVSTRADLRLIDLGPLAFDAEVGAFSAMGINDRGEIIANGGANGSGINPVAMGASGSSTEETPQAFYYREGAFRSLSTNPCTATAINNAGQIVGCRWILVTNIGYSSPGGVPAITNVGYAQQPVSFRNGLPVNLFPGLNYGDAMGVNDSGEIVGSVSLSNVPTHGFACLNGLTTDLGSGFMATGINNLGDIVGQSFTFSSMVHPMLYHDGLTEDLGTLGGTDGSATAINDLGEIIGWSTTTNADTHAFLYRNGTMTDLGTLGVQTNFPGVSFPSYCSALAINNWGQIVGTSTAANGTHAFFYWDGSMVDLNGLVKLTHLKGPAGFLTLTSAEGINDSGQIVGEGLYWDRRQESSHAFLLDLRPEPQTDGHSR
ncbi:MAG: hypothetical protein ABSE16_15615 [Verrucomicrobiota bacterium]|jgi:probable HAF family extracellular repeat protein